MGFFVKMQLLLVVILTIFRWNCVVLGLRFTVPIQRSKVPVDTLDNYKQGSLSFDLSVGTPPQTFRVIFDTTRTEVSFVGKKCIHPAYLLKEKYDASKSSSYQAILDTLIFKYGKSKQTGETALETVRVGTSTIRNQLVTEITKLERPPPNPDIDGMGGFAWQEPGEFRAGSLPYNMNLDPKMFSIYLNRVDGGEAVFGGMNADIEESEIHYIPILSLLIYTWGVDGVYTSASDYDVTKGGCRAVIDPGTELILGRPQIIDPLMGGIGAVMDPLVSSGRYIIECLKKDTGIPIYLRSEDRRFKIPSEKYVLGPVVASRGLNWCLTAFVSLEIQPALGVDIMLGVPFILDKCIIHDVANKQIGITGSEPWPTNNPSSRQ